MAERNDVKIVTTQRSAEEIRQDIAAKRESISSTVERLGVKIQDSLDWREYVTRHPYMAVGLAAGAGVIVAGFLGGRRKASRPGRRIMDALADLAEDLAGDARKSVRKIVVKAGAPVVVRGAARGALGGILSKAVADFVREKFVASVGGSQPPHETTTTVYSSKPPNPSGIS